MFGDYVRLLRNPDLWERLGWTIVDRKSFVELLDDVRRIRNEIMHFRPEPLSREQLHHLDQFRGMLRILDPR